MRKSFVMFAQKMSKNDLINDENVKLIRLI